MKLSRRRFIMSSALGGLALASEPWSDFLSHAFSNRPLIKKSLKFSMVQGNMSILDKFRLLKDLGFDGVEMDSPNELDNKEILAARDQTGLEIPGVVNSRHWKLPLSHPDKQIREQCVEATKTALNDCKAYGGTTVLLVAGIVNETISYDEAYQRTTDAIEKILPEAEKTGVKIAIENVWNNFLLSPMEAARYIDEFDNPMIGWYFDVGNILRYGWPEHWIRTLGKRIFKIDIKDYSKVKMREEGLWKGFDVKLAEGDVDWKKVNKALSEIGYKGWGSAEVKGGEKERLKEIAERMDRIYGMV